MKKLNLILLFAFACMSGLFAQNVDDALRYSQIFYGGSARFQSMGGAFTALGGDLSTLSQNPAGLGVFRSSELSISPQLYHINTDASFHGNATDYLYNFNLGQIGVVTNIISKDNTSGLLKLNFGYAFNKTNNFNQAITIHGVSNAGSLADEWAGQGNIDQLRPDELPGPAGIAYDSWVIDTITGSGGRSYGTVFSNYGDANNIYGQDVRRLISYEGYSGEHALSIGGNYSNKLFFGATLGINTINFTSHFEHLETTGQSLPSLFDNFNYVDHYENTGTGVSLKIGAIAKPVENVRIGLAFHSPTWYRINEYFYESITSDFTDGYSYDNQNDPMRYKYALATPFRALAGAAVQIGKIALLSADYEFVDYGSARFNNIGDDYDYSEKNSIIKNSLKPAHSFRVGGELRLDKFYLRSGYGYYGQAFRSGEDNSGLDYSSISFGAGFREQNVYFDLGYTNMRSSMNYVLFSPAGFDPASAYLNTTRNMFTATLGFKFGY